jgi:hypothetical protein
VCYLLPIGIIVKRTYPINWKTKGTFATQKIIYLSNLNMCWLVFWLYFKEGTINNNKHSTVFCCFYKLF